MKKYYIDGNEVEELKFIYELSEVCYDLACEHIDEDIDNTNELIHIGSLTYYPSIVLSETDPIAYRCWISDLQDNYYSSKMEQLENGCLISINDVRYMISEL